MELHETFSDENKCVHQISCDASNSDEVDIH